MLALIVAAVLWLALVACGGRDDETSLDVTMQDFAFVPDTYTVPAASQVTLTLHNAGSVEHEWVLFEKGFELQPDEFFGEEAEEAVYWEAEVEEPGESETFTFTAPEEAGTYQVVCGVKGHFELGMHGTLNVTTEGVTTD
jgi:uncharacterized cupredoxin-like copper-binding protein